MIEIAPFQLVNAVGGMGYAITICTHGQNKIYEVWLAVPTFNLSNELLG